MPLSIRTRIPILFITGCGALVALAACTTGAVDRPPDNGSQPTPTQPSGATPGAQNTPTAAASSGGGGQLQVRHLTDAGPSFNAEATELYEVAASQQRWEELWTQRFSSEAVRIKAPPPVDFSKEFVAWASWGTQPNGCYRLTIDSAALNQQEIAITVNQVVEQGACIEALTEPYDIVAVNRETLQAGTYQVRFATTDGKELATRSVDLP